MNVAIKSRFSEFRWSKDSACLNFVTNNSPENIVLEFRPLESYIGIVL